MPIMRCLSWSAVALILPFAGFFLPGSQESGPAVPPFGRNTVLVYESSLEEGSTFVVRIAEFSPDRWIEWEDSTTQGTILMPEKSILEGREFVNYRLYQGGVDSRSKNATTLWLSRRIFRELDVKPKVKVTIDSLSTWVTVLGRDQMDTEINRVNRRIPVIKTRDERGTERWFLDLEDNPLLVNFQFRNYRQKLVSITTDRQNTLRWIKAGKKKPPAGP